MSCKHEKRYEVKFSTFKYFYCPNCKKEVSEHDVPDDLLKEFEEMLTDKEYKVDACKSYDQPANKDAETIPSSYDIFGDDVNFNGLSRL